MLDHAAVQYDNSSSQYSTLLATLSSMLAYCHRRSPAWQSASAAIRTASTATSHCHCVLSNGSATRQ